MNKKSSLLFLAAILLFDILLAVVFIYQLTQLSGFPSSVQTGDSARPGVPARIAESSRSVPAAWEEPLTQPVYIAEPKMIALTFDDGPDATYTPALLDGLKARNIKATFFLIGASIPGNEDILRRMAEEGHLIGVHCLHHKDLTQEEIAEANRQLEETKKLITEAVGQTPTYMRPPFGRWNETLRDHISMEPVFWTVDSLDWKLQNTQKIVKKVLDNTKNGDVILMHDEFATSVEAAFQIIDNLSANGYTFVTVDELSID